LGSKDSYVVWPAYLDYTISRGRGRKIGKGVAVNRPSAEEVFRAAKNLGLNPIMENKKYPKSWYEHTKRIVVDKRLESKTKTIKAIAEEILKERGMKKSHKF